MQIESIEIKNYRLFRHAKLSGIPRLCVLVGANGAGKSTLFDVFSFLKDALAMNVSKAVSKRGGFKELASRGFAQEPIELTLQFRLDITGKERLVTYLLRVQPEWQPAVRGNTSVVLVSGVHRSSLEAIAFAKRCSSGAPARSRGVL